MSTTARGTAAAAISIAALEHGALQAASVAAVATASAAEAQAEAAEGAVTAPPSKRFVTNAVGAQPEAVTGGEMRDYQLDGLDYLVGMFDRGANCILGDEMGLGKTLQTIAMIAYLKFERKLRGPALVVCPLSVLSSWMNEFKRWCPSLKVVRLHSTVRCVFVCL